VTQRKVLSVSLNHLIGAFKTVVKKNNTIVVRRGKKRNRLNIGFAFCFHWEEELNFIKFLRML